MSYYRQSPFANLTPVVKNLLIINFLFFGATIVLARVNIDMVRLFSAFYFDSPFFKPWQIITYMFMHDPQGFAHIIGNMIVLFFFGPMLEREMGSKRFFNFYFICGIGALLCNVAMQAIEVHSLLHSFGVTDWNSIYGSPAFFRLQQIYLTPTLGASGAIYGLFVAMLMLFPDVEIMEMFIPFPIKAKYIIICYIAIEIFSVVKGTSGDGIAHFAHIGGALFGFLIIKTWRLNRHDNFYH